jgi:hypothetical protein
MAALGQHVGDWASLLEIQVTPVVEDDVAGEVMARVYGS